MVNLAGITTNIDTVKDKISKIKLLFTDVDGVLTDTGVYYSDRGEEMKRYSIRDGMGVERIRDVGGIDVGIITGESSPSLVKRCEKLKITRLYLGVKDKKTLLANILAEEKLTFENVAYIGDDYNDIDIIKSCGLTACPSDGMPLIKNLVDYITQNKGGNGAFRDFVELILTFKVYKD